MAHVILNKDINLLPKYKLEEKSKRKSKDLVTLALAGVLIALGLFSFFSMNNYYNTIAYRDDLTAKIEKLNETEKRIGELERVKSYIQARVKYQENIDKTNTSMIKLLEFLENERSNGVYLSGFSDSTKDGRKQITITGAALSKEAIADFEEKLIESEMFSSVFMPSLTQADKADSTSVFGDEATNIPLIKFSIICVLM